MCMKRKLTVQATLTWKISSVFRNHAIIEVDSPAVSWSLDTLTVSINNKHRVK